MSTNEILVDVGDGGRITAAAATKTGSKVLKGGAVGMRMRCMRFFWWEVAGFVGGWIMMMMLV